MDRFQLLSIFCSLLGMFLGALASLLTTVFVHKKQMREEKQKWINEKVFDVFLELSGKLSKTVSVVLDEDKIPYLNQLVFRQQLNDLNMYIESHEGLLALFLNKEIYGDIVKLKSVLYKIVSSKDDIPFAIEDLSDRSTLVGDFFARREIIKDKLKKYLGIDKFVNKSSLFY